MSKELFSCQIGESRSAVACTAYFWRLDWRFRMSRHELEGQKTSADVDLFQTFGDFCSQVGDANLGLFLIPKSDPVLYIISAPFLSIEIQTSDCRLTFISALILFLSLCGSSFRSSCPLRYPKTISPVFGPRVFWNADFVISSRAPHLVVPNFSSILLAVE